jgi:TRAP-type mannitol/chloroaromatic compound transport system permease small subunit
MGTLRICLSIIDKVNELVAKIISWAVIIIVGVTVYEVIMRYAFNAPTQWAFEFNYLLHGPYFLLLGAYTFAIRGHVNVDIFYGRFSPRTRAVFDLFTAPILFFFIIIMFWFGGKYSLNSVAFRETLSSAWGPPIYPVKLVIPVAAALLILQGVAKFIRDLHIALTGREGEL